MKRARLWTWLALVLLLVLASACGGGTESTPTPQGQPQPAAVQPTPTQPPTKPTSQPTPISAKPTPAPNTSPTRAEPDTSSNAEQPPKVTFGLPRNAQNIQDFRAHFIVRVIAEGLPDKEGMPSDMPLLEWTIEQTRDPAAKRMVMEGMMIRDNMRGEAREQGVMEIIQVEDKVWMKAGGSVLMITDSETPKPDEDLKDLSSMFSATDWEKQGQETVNGFDTIHYHTEVDLTKMQSSGLGFAHAYLGKLGIMPMDVRPQELTGDVYATEDGLVVKAVYRTTYVAKTEGKEIPVTEEVTYEVEGTNLGLVIQPPEMETPSSVIPLPESAQILMSMSGMNIYEIPSMNMADVLAFYRETLPQEGFAIVQDLASPDEGGMIQVSKEGKKYMLLLQVEGEKVTVAVQETP